MVYIGARRSTALLKVHLLNPRDLYPSSNMPSYAHLFDDGRGDDLVQYLKESGIDSTADLMAKSAAWKPADSATEVDGKSSLFSQYCVACHGAFGGGNGPLSWHFARPPAQTKSPFIWTAAGNNLDLRVSRVIKFGIPGTDMPGHETLPDAEVVALMRYVLALRGD